MKIGVIHDLATEIRNQILQGHPVKISNLSIFKVGIETDCLRQSSSIRRRASNASSLWLRLPATRNQAD